MRQGYTRKEINEEVLLIYSDVVVKGDLVAEGGVVA